MKIKYTKINGVNMWLPGRAELVRHNKKQRKNILSDEQYVLNLRSKDAETRNEALLMLDDAKCWKEATKDVHPTIRYYAHFKADMLEELTDDKNSSCRDIAFKLLDKKEFWEKALLDDDEEIRILARERLEKINLN